MQEIKYKKVNLENYPQLKIEAKKAGILFSKETDIYLMTLGTKTVGICGLLLRKGSAVMKCDYVKPYFRRQGILKECIKRRIKLCQDKGIQRISAHCTKMALNVHLSCGAIIKKNFKNGITEVQYTIPEK